MNRIKFLGGLLLLSNIVWGSAISTNPTLVTGGGRNTARPFFES